MGGLLIFFSFYTKLVDFLFIDSVFDGYHARMLNVVLSTSVLTSNTFDY